MKKDSLQCTLNIDLFIASVTIFYFYNFGNIILFSDMH